MKSDAVEEESREQEMTEKQDHDYTPNGEEEKHLHLIPKRGNFKPAQLLFPTEIPGH